MVPMFHPGDPKLVPKPINIVCPVLFVFPKSAGRMTEFPRMPGVIWVSLLQCFYQRGTEGKEYRMFPNMDKILESNLVPVFEGSNAEVWCDRFEPATKGEGGVPFP